MSSNTKAKVSAEVLRTLHRIHRQRTDLLARESRGPRQLAAGQAQVKEAEAAVEAAREKLKQARLAADEKQLQLRTREQRVEDLKGKLNVAASNVEYQSFKDQIAADEQANSVLSDEIFDVLEQIDEFEAGVKEAEQQLADRRSEYEQLEREVEKKLTVIRADLENVEAQLREAEKELPRELRSEYERVIASRGEDALAGVEDASCGVCYQTLTTQMLNSLYLSQLVRCPNCGALLYLPEDRSA